MFVDPVRQYEQEGLQLDLPIFDHDMDRSVKLIDEQASRQIGENDRKGILWLLDEEALFPNSSAETFSPVAASTRGGPPKNIVPILSTKTISSHIEGW